MGSAVSERVRVGLRLGCWTAREWRGFSGLGWIRPSWVRFPFFFCSFLFLFLFSVFYLNLILFDSNFHRKNSLIIYLNRREYKVLWDYSSEVLKNKIKNLVALIIAYEWFLLYLSV